MAGDEQGEGLVRRLRAVGDDGHAPGNDAEAVDPEASGDPDRHRRRGIYLLPNLITTGALFAGFFAIVAAMNGRFETAAIAIFAAMVLDAADGRVARLTHTESAFGAEYDSLSDMVAFGVAPALVIFTWSLQSLGQAGWVASFIYMACAALRLARFNMRHDNSTFVGLASPSAAAIVAGTVWIFTDIAPTAAGPTGLGAALLAVLTAAAGLLMVSPFRYWSPKLINLKGRVPFISLVAIVLVYALVMLDPPRVLLAGFVLYALSGPVTSVLRRRRHAAARAARSGGESDA
ncbi:MAG: CDP-diacylglycerol--serine O-phosphatidyltransferase [Pseudomonadales bacterium]|jgi:CDP-diacylglycerol--serine O-phosphatidyltransferase|nr:CDP-diacylglycerol--serine O-phosphatidyltransferase [Pseudomonadales bacterium]